jgi:uncharacterized protein YdhG (YjbR/CyaY superfamily)
MARERKPKTVDAYIAGAPKKVRGKLNELRSVIMKTVQNAEERLSYGMPYYSYNGRLAYFRHWKNHIGLYLPTPVIEEFRKELAGYETARATVRFPLDKELPAALIRKLVKARAKMNEERLQK